MATGLYKTSDDFVAVDYGTHVDQLVRSKYEASGFRPTYAQLPTESEYNESKQKSQFDAISKEMGKTPQERSS
jgi:hypothetical protein